MIYGLLCNEESYKAMTLERATIVNIFHCRVPGFEAGICFITRIALNQVH